MPTDKSYSEYVDKCRRQREKIRSIIQNTDIDKDLVFEIKPIKELAL